MMVGSRHGTMTVKKLSGMIVLFQDYVYWMSWLLLSLTIVDIILAVNNGHRFSKHKVLFYQTDKHKF